MNFLGVLYVGVTPEGQAHYWEEGPYEVIAKSWANSGSTLSWGVTLHFITAQLGGGFWGPLFEVRSFISPLFFFSFLFSFFLLILGGFLLLLPILPPLSHFSSHTVALRTHQNRRQQNGIRMVPANYSVHWNPTVHLQSSDASDAVLPLPTQQVWLLYYYCLSPLLQMRFAESSYRQTHSAMAATSRG